MKCVCFAFTATVLASLARAQKTTRVWHIMPPQFTTLAEKNAGDYLGDIGYILNACGYVDVGIIEQSTVNVTGWGRYQACNYRGDTYSCGQNTKNSLPGTMKAAVGRGGIWYSFPKVSQGVTWTEKLERRITSKCLMNAFRKDAGGCPSCGPSDVRCVTRCVRSLSADKLRNTWNQVFDSTEICPDEPLPSPSRDDLQVQV